MLFLIKNQSPSSPFYTPGIFPDPDPLTLTYGYENRSIPLFLAFLLFPDFLFFSPTIPLFLLSLLLLTNLSLIIATIPTIFPTTFNPINTLLGSLI
jgi:hypothetical protein